MVTPPSLAPPRTNSAIFDARYIGIIPRGDHVCDLLMFCFCFLKKKMEILGAKTVSHLMKIPLSQGPVSSYGLAFFVGSCLVTKGHQEKT